MKRKHYLVLLFLTLVGLNACSDDDNDDNNFIANNSKIKLIANKTEIEPFEDIKVSIDVDLELLLSAYDSIRWETNTSAYGSFSSLGFFILGLNNHKDFNITDYRIGNFKTYAFGYKDGNIISSDSIEYEVKKSTGNFINIRWNKWNDSQRSETFSCTTGLSPYQYIKEPNGRLSLSGVELKLYHSITSKNIEYAELGFTIWSYEVSNYTRSQTVSNINDFDWSYSLTDKYSLEKYRAQALFESDFFHNYLTDLYGISNYIYEGKDPSQTTLIDEYKQRFANNRNSDFYPCEIWQTSTSYICLLVSQAQLGEGLERGICKVIAEPRY